MKTTVAELLGRHQAFGLVPDACKGLVDEAKFIAGVRARRPWLSVPGGKEPPPGREVLPVAETQRLAQALGLGGLWTCYMQAVSTALDTEVQERIKQALLDARSEIEASISDLQKEESTLARVLSSTAEVIMSLGGSFNEVVDAAAALAAAAGVLLAVERHGEIVGGLKVTDEWSQRLLEAAERRSRRLHDRLRRKQMAAGAALSIIDRAIRDLDPESRVRRLRARLVRELRSRLYGGHQPAVPAGHRLFGGSSTAELSKAAPGRPLPGMVRVAPIAARQDGGQNTAKEGGKQRKAAAKREAAAEPAEKKVRRHNITAQQRAAREAARKAARRRLRARLRQRARGHQLTLRALALGREHAFVLAVKTAIRWGGGVRAVEKARAIIDRVVDVKSAVAVVEELGIHKAVDQLLNAWDDKLSQADAKASMASLFAAKQDGGKDAEVLLVEAIRGLGVNARHASSREDKRASTDLVVEVDGVEVDVQLTTMPWIDAARVEVQYAKKRLHRGRIETGEAVSKVQKDLEKHGAHSVRPFLMVGVNVDLEYPFTPAEFAGLVIELAKKAATDGVVIAFCATPKVAEVIR